MGDEGELPKPKLTAGARVVIGIFVLLLIAIGFTIYASIRYPTSGGGGSASWQSHDDSSCVAQAESAGEITAGHPLSDSEKRQAVQAVCASTYTP